MDDLRLTKLLIQFILIVLVGFVAFIHTSTIGSLDTGDSVVAATIVSTGKHLAYVVILAVIALIVGLGDYFSDFTGSEGELVKIRKMLENAGFELPEEDED